MTPVEFAEKYGLEVLSEGEQRQIEGIYCCDLLSMVMGKAKENDAFFTVMGNVNSVAVGVLADVSCVVLCEGIRLDEDSLNKAKSQGVCVLSSQQDSFSTALKLARELGLCS